MLRIHFLSTNEKIRFFPCDQGYSFPEKRKNPGALGTRMSIICSQLFASDVVVSTPIKGKVFNNTYRNDFCVYKWPEKWTKKQNKKKPLIDKFRIFDLRAELQELFIVLRTEQIISLVWSWADLQTQFATVWQKPRVLKLWGLFHGIHWMYFTRFCSQTCWKIVNIKRVFRDISREPRKINSVNYVKQLSHFELSICM